LIEALMRLGTALGYYADDEVRVTASGGAVDVAWFRGATARVPLFIFEVETTASSSAANNPLKVFAQKTDVLPKPLFYFHVFLTKSEQTERTELLEEQYGRFNYRVYRGGGIDPTAIVRDVLNQHRRVATDLDIRPLVAALRHPGWANVDLNAVLETVKSEDFRACYVPDYARLSYDDKRFRPHLVRQLTARQPYPAPLADDECWYATFIGSLYAPFLHAGIAARESRDETTMLSRLRGWQEGSTGSTMLQLGPYLGLSQDYDYFVLGAAAPFLALTEALFRSDEARR
jgi:hypothetical protein